MSQLENTIKFLKNFLKSLEKLIFIEHHSISLSTIKSKKLYIKNMQLKRVNVGI